MLVSPGRRERGRNELVCWLSEQVRRIKQLSSPITQLPTQTLGTENFNKQPPANGQLQKLLRVMKLHSLPLPIERSPRERTATANTDGQKLAKTGQRPSRARRKSPVTKIVITKWMAERQWIIVKAQNRPEQNKRCFYSGGTRETFSRKCNDSYIGNICIRNTKFVLTD